MLWGGLHQLPPKSQFEIEACTILPPLPKASHTRVLCLQKYLEPLEDIKPPCIDLVTQILRNANSLRHQQHAPRHEFALLST